MASPIAFATPRPVSITSSSTRVLSPRYPVLPLRCPALHPLRPNRLPMIPPKPALPPVPVPQAALHEPHLPSLDAYRSQYADSIADPDAYWASVADGFVWHDEADDSAASAPAGGDTAKALTYNFDPTAGPVAVSFLKHRKTNVCYNALDRWLEDPDMRSAVAYYHEGNHPDDSKAYTFAEMSDMVNRFANVLRTEFGVKKGDVVIIYMPMVPELPAAMLACARIGAVHSVVFGGFSAEALASRIVDSAAKVVVVAQSVMRATKTIPLKAIADSALDIAEKAGHLVSYQVVTGAAEHVDALKDGRDFRWEQLCAKASPQCDVEWVESEHPLFILYTSGSTGKPKGVVHHTGGYMVYSAHTFKHSFDYHRGEVFFSTSDCGWITGHSYVTYGPMLNGATQVLFEGVPTYPTAGRLWEIVEKYKVNQLYTAPTVIRSLKGTSAPPSTTENPEPTSDDWVRACNRSSLRVLGTVGEPINPEAWQWYFDVVGDKRCAIVDTWWQTETGGHCLTPLPIPGLDLKPGCAMMPFFGIEPVLVDADGKELDGEAEGFLLIKRPWPSTLRTVYGDHARMEATYFERFPGYYMTGDGARRDKDGHYWLTGRVDDILNVSGHRIGTAEVESALVSHSAVAEAAVVGVPHAVKGEALYAYVTLMGGVEPSDELRVAIRAQVRSDIGPFAAPDTVHWAPALPKTRSGKIMRRILRKIAADGESTDVGGLGDTTTLTDPGVVSALISSYGK